MSASDTAIARPRKRKRSINNDGIKGFLFILPNLIGFLVFTIIPIIFTVGISFTKWDFYKGFDGFEWVGIDNYVSLVNDIWFIDSLKNNLFFTAGTIPVLLVISLLIAVVMNTDIFGRKIVRTMIFVPYIVSMVAVAAVGVSLFNPSNGPINQMLRSLGIQNTPGWFSSIEWALPGVMIIFVWQMLGYDFIIFLAGLQAIPDELYESAKIDGAGSFRRLWNVTVPMLSPTTFFLLITNIIASFQVFGLINVLTQGGPGRATSVLAYYIYLCTFRFSKMGLGAAVAIVLFGIILVTTLIQWIIQKKINETF